MACSAISRLTSQYDLQLLTGENTENDQLSDSVTDHSGLVSEHEDSITCSLVNPKFLRSRDREEDDYDQEFKESPRKKLACEVNSSPRSIGLDTTSSEETEKSLGFLSEAYIYQGDVVEEIDFELGLDLDEMRNMDIFSELSELRSALNSEQDLLFKKQLTNELETKVLHAAFEFLLTRSFDRIPDVLSMIEGVSSFDNMHLMSNLAIRVLIAGDQKNALACLRFISESLDESKSFKSDLVLFFHKIAYIQGSLSLTDSFASSLSIEQQLQLTEQQELFDVVFKNVDLSQLLPKVIAELATSSDEAISESRQKYFIFFALRMGFDRNFEVAAHILSRLRFTPECVEVARKLSLIALLESDFESFECFIESLSEQFSIQDLLLYLIPRKEIPFMLRVSLLKKLKELTLEGEFFQDLLLYLIPRKEIPFMLRVSLLKKLKELTLEGEFFEEVSALLCAEAYRVGHVRFAEYIFQSVMGEFFLPLINFEKDLCEFKIEWMLRRSLNSSASLHISAEVGSRYKGYLEMVSLGDLNAMHALLQDLPESFHDVCLGDVFSVLINQKKFDLAYDFIERFCGGSARLDLMLADLAISAAAAKMSENFDKIYFDPRALVNVAFRKAKIRLECHLGLFSKAVDLLSSLPPLEESEFVFGVLETFFKNRQAEKVVAFLKRFLPLYVSMQFDEEARDVFYRKAFKILIANGLSEDCLSFFANVACKQERDRMFDAFIRERCELR